MKRSFRFLLLFDRYAIPPLLVFAAIILGGNFLVGGNINAQNSFSSLFVTYLNAWPLMSGVILGCLCIASYSIYSSLALSMGGRRRDFFWANQLNFLIYLGFVWVTQLVLDAFSAHFSWESMELWGTVPASRNLALIPVMLMLMAGGSCLGILSTRKPKLAIFLVVVSVLLFLVVLVAAMFISGSQRAELWGDLPWLIPAGTAALTLVFEGLLWHFSQDTVVR